MFIIWNFLHQIISCYQIQKSIKILQMPNVDTGEMHEQLRYFI